MSLFATLALLIEREPNPAAVNMAMDEVLLEEISVPILRAYGWLRPAVSFGYFEKYADIEKKHGDRELVRRWTGGGVVMHGEDFTYSLLIPRNVPLMKMAPADSYQSIHVEVAAAMAECGVAAVVTGATEPKISTACFENPVRHDVVRNGRKIAGAAQRRTRSGLLHQGSIQTAELPEDFAEKLAGRLGGDVIPLATQPAQLTAAVGLAESKYASPQWMRKY